MMATAARHANAGWQLFRVPVIHGIADKRIGTGEGFDTRLLGSLWSLPPTSRPKHQALAFLPSLYCEHDARDHSVQRDKGNFVALCGDVDYGNHPIDHIEQAVRARLGNVAYNIYSTANAVEGDMRWRVVVPLARPAAFADWRDAEEAFSEILRGDGIELDGVTARAGQIMYLPNVPTVHHDTGQPLRDESGPLYYATRTTNTDVPGLWLDAGSLADAIADLRCRHTEDERLREKLRTQAAQRRANQPQTKDGSVIDAFNRSNTVADMLAIPNRLAIPTTGDHRTRRREATRPETWATIGFRLAKAIGPLGSGRPAPQAAMVILMTSLCIGSTRATVRLLGQQRAGNKGASALATEITPWRSHRHTQ
jgi:hypothetical protein